MIFMKLDDYYTAVIETQDGYIYEQKYYDFKEFVDSIKNDIRYGGYRVVEIY